MTETTLFLILSPVLFLMAVIAPMAFPVSSLLVGQKSVLASPLGSLPPLAVLAVTECYVALQP